MKLKKVFLSLTFISLLFSCGPNPHRDNIAFLDKYEASIFYRGEKPSYYKDVKNYHDYNFEDVSSTLGNYSLFVMDVTFMDTIPSISELDRLYDCLLAPGDVYIFFVKYRVKMPFLAGTKFTRYYTAYNMEKDHDVVVFRNNFHGFINCTTMTYSYGTSDNNVKVELNPKTNIFSFFQYIKESLLEN